jgi:hypothetical protein
MMSVQLDMHSPERAEEPAPTETYSSLGPVVLLAVLSIGAGLALMYL